MTNKFNPKEWLNKQTVNSDQDSVGSDNSLSPSPHHSISPSDHQSEVETILARIEETQTDITATYSDWLSLGFAFANDCAEAGREYYHRISRFYPGYSVTDCDKQYDHCLKAKGHGITIKTFYHLAKQAGIEITMRNPMGQGYDWKIERWDDWEIGRDQTVSSDGAAGNDPFAPSSLRTLAPLSSEVDQSPLNTESEHCLLPNLPESIFAELPEFLTRVLSLAETKEERDVLLLGAITVLGCCMPNMYGHYDGDRVHPNLYLFVTSNASAGKGRLKHCKSLVKPVHFALRKEAQQLQQEYENKMREYNVERLKDASTEKPAKPAQRMLFLPANCSAAGMFQLLSDNNGIGLIFETEGDTLSMAFKSDHGNYSDGYRKAFHHESISYYRKTDHEFVDIDYPQLSTVLAGTNKQVASLIPSAENGLLSRFIFYYMNIRPVWKNVFSRTKDTGIAEHFNLLGYEYFKLYEALREGDAIEFCFTKRQKQEFHQFFSQLQDKYLTLQDMEYMATIRRLGLIAFRIAMIFNGLRIMETGDFSPKQECQDVDFYASLAMIKVLIRHSSHVFTQLQEEVKTTKKANKKEMFFDLLPVEFTYQDFIKLAKSIEISERTANRYMTEFCSKGLIGRIDQKTYTNRSLKSDDIDDKVK